MRHTERSGGEARDASLTRRATADAASPGLTRRDRITSIGSALLLIRYSIKFPAGVVFPVSAAILERVDGYRAALEDYSRRLLPVVDWKPTEDGNVRVLNDTADFYRFFDATPQAEFLYGCVQQTIEVDLPRETECLARYDRFRARIEG